MSQDPLLVGAGRMLRAGARRRHWHDDPAGFAREAIAWPEGSELAPYQGEAMAGLAEKHRVAVRSPHAAGKTTEAALTILWFAATRDAAGTDWKVVTTAGAWRQLEKYLWPEVRLWASRIRWDVLGLEPWRQGREIFEMGLKLQHGEAFAGASDRAELLEGAHADSILLVLDEAKSIPSSVFDAVEGALSGQGEAFALAVSTPGEPSGRFYEICSRKPGTEDWSARHVTLEQAIAAGRVNREWAAQRALQWGATSAVYLNRVRGEFASSDEDSTIALQSVEEAVERWRAWDDAGRPEPAGRKIVSCDPARFGGDQTAIAVRQGDVVTLIERHHREDTMETSGRLKAKLTHPLDICVVDVIGLGGGVVDRLREQKVQVSAFNASERSRATDRSGELGFANQRSEMWWKLRELLDPTFGSTICLPPDDQLLGDLCSPKWSVTSTGKVQIESKDEIRKRLGRSTDVGDAVAMAFTLSSAAQVHIDMSPVAIEPDMSRLFTPDPKWGRGPLFTEPREYPQIERVEGPEADRFPGPDDPPAKRVPPGSGGVW